MAKPESHPKHLGRYDIVSVLGKGAMGVVYSGIDPRLQRKVAIKTVLKSALDSDTAKEYSMRFDREARAVARLNHPNIVQVYDFGEEVDVAYIVMEFIQGKELKAFFNVNERFEPKEAVHIMCELCDALHFAHEAGIVHRDIKPANVMIDSQGRVKLADFGVARISDADRGAVEKTQAGAIIGTPGYMSPEQIEGKEIDRRSDIFSAGIILYQFLTGERPFTGASTWTIAKQILQDNPPIPSSVNKSIPPLFDAVVNKALAKDVANRYQTAQEFGIALKHALEGKAEDHELDTVIMAEPAPDSVGRAAPAEVRVAPSTAAQELELEFWRSIKDGNDPDDFELYVKQFPEGIYAALAKRMIAKLRGLVPPPGDSAARDRQAQEQERREAEEAARREAEVKAKIADEKAKLDAELAKREAEFQKRQAEAEARREADAKTRAEAEAKAKGDFEAALAKREAELMKREADAKVVEREIAQKKMAPWIPVGVGLLIAAIGAGVYVAMKPDASAREAELVKMLEEAKKTNAELVLAKQREQELIQQVELARKSEAEAKASGDVAKQRELAEQTRLREAEAQKQTELIKKREAEAQKQAELTKQRQAELQQQAELKRQADAKKAAEKGTQRDAEQAKQAADKAAVEKLAADKAAADKAVADKAAADKAAADKVVAEKAAADKAAAEKAAVDKAATGKAVAEKADAEKTIVASVDTSALLKQGQAAETGGDVRAAVRFYTQAARAGNGEAAKLLGDIYSNGRGNVPRDYAESLRWYVIAEKAGIKIERARR